jgi:hypothetical protein
MSVQTQTVTLSAVGVSSPVLFRPLLSSGAPLLPSVLVFVSSGASLTYSVEVTGDYVAQLGYTNSATSGNWQPFTGMSGLTGNYANSLGAAVTALRLRVTAWTGGTVTLQFVQVTA